MMIVVVSTVSFLPLQEARASIWLYYDDGTSLGNFNCAETNRDLAVKFTLPGGGISAQLLTISAFKTASEISGSTGNLIVHVLGSDFSTELASFPFTLDPPGGFFRSVSVPGYVVVPSVFYIVLSGNPEACIGLDESSSSGHSYYRQGGGEWTPDTGELMVRAEVESSAAVGGIVMPTNKLEIVAPFAALAGLIVAVSAVVAFKKRRD
jgi:hypothetical protein